MVETRGIVLFAMVLYLGLRTWDLGWHLMTAFLSSLYGPGFVLFAFIENAAWFFYYAGNAVYRISGHGIRGLYD